MAHERVTGSAALGSRLVACSVVVGSCLTCIGPGAAAESAGTTPVLTQILGTSLKYGSKTLTDDRLAQCVQDLSGKGFSLSWDASPATWARHVLENEEQLTFIRRKVALLHAHGMGASFGFRWRSLLPPKDHSSFDATWLAEGIDPETGGIAPTETPRWDVGSETAREAFGTRSRQFFERVGRCEMFYVDEELFASPGQESHARKVSTYWTSPTYSLRSLASFRGYLAERGFAGADSAGFPVTTVAVDPSPEANMGLPAVPITDANRERLTADNEWPTSALWRHWYDWRADLYASWIDEVTLAAAEVWGDGPAWQGCMVCHPVHWFVPALGPDLDRLAQLPEVDYLVAGYTTGHRFAPVKAAAERHGKKWGGMVELTRYGQPVGMDPDLITSRFRLQVEAGASVMLAYPGCNFRTDRKDLPEDHGARTKGMCYMPEQVAAWSQCIDWLENNRGYGRVVEQGTE